MSLAVLPAPAWEEMLRRLDAADVAALRLVSAGIGAKATHGAPAITLRLSATTAAAAGTPPAGVLCRAWRAATQRLDAAPAVNVVLSGSLSPQDWGAAVHALAARGNVRSLSLRAPPHHSGSSSGSVGGAASVPSLSPLRQLLFTELQALALGEGVFVGGDLAGELTQLLSLRPPAATAAPTSYGRQLRRLELCGPWSALGSIRAVSSFSAALALLPAACPRLQQLKLVLPAFAAPAEAPTPAPGARPLPLTGPAAVREAQRNQAAALAAVAAAVAQLQHLEVLTISRLPDMWTAQSGGSSSSIDGAATAAAAALADAAAATGLPPGTLASLDSVGAWLLRAPTLTALQLDTLGGGCSMSWSRAARDASSSDAATELPAIRLTCRAAMPLSMASPAPSAGRDTAANELLPHLSRQLGIYSGRPAPVLLRRVVSLQAVLQPQQVASAAAALAAMPALQHLKLTVLATSSQPVDLRALAAAAAAAKGLSSLVLLPGLGKVALPGAALAPLTSGCTGLKQLKLVGNFASSDEDAPWQMLAEGLPGLQVLRLQQLGPELLRLPASMLPASLREFEGKRLHLTADSGISIATRHSQLQSLHLQECRVDALGALASTRLRDLFASATTWPGGWAAAVEAWPHLQQLTLWCPLAKSGLQAAAAAAAATAAAAAEEPGSGGSGGGGRDAPSAADRAAEASAVLVQQLCGFEELRVLELQHLAAVSPGVLRTVLQRLPKLRHVGISASAVSTGFEQQLAAACGEAAGAGSSGGSNTLAASASLRSVRLRLPVVLARHLNPVPVAAAGGGAGVAAAIAGAADGIRRQRGEAQAVQQSLLALLPWCNVEVAADMCMLY